MTARAGIDLNPLDPADPDAAAWLENLVWPEHGERRARLRAALAVAAASPCCVEAGDMRTELARRVEALAGNDPVVVYHSAVAAYLSPSDRERFDLTMRGLVAAGACRWVSNEAPGVLPSVTATAATEPPDAAFVLGVDGRAVAFTDGRVAWARWLGA